MQDKAAIVFGGSYGGMLAGWLRMKFPNTFQGALAASAPSLYFKGAPSAPEYAYAEICTDDFRKQLDKSPELIQEAFVDMMSTQTRPSAWDQMSDIFNTCDPISSDFDVNNLYLHLSNGYQYMAMTDYPYPASFLEPMPAWPINEAVKPFEPIPTQAELSQPKVSQVEDDLFSMVASYTSDVYDMLVSGSQSLWDLFIDEVVQEDSPLSDREVQLFEALAESTNIYFNYTGNYPCTNLSDWEGTGDLDGYGWNILACNQMAMPIGYGPDSMFIETAFDYDSYSTWCQESFGLTPDWDWALRYFGGFDIDRDFLGMTNIIFSNGELDPWRAGGLNKNVTADGSGIALYIEAGAHHLDLRPPNDADPASVTEARNVEMANIKQWISEYQSVPMN